MAIWSLYLHVIEQCDRTPTNIEHKTEFEVVYFTITSYSWCFLVLQISILSCQSIYAWFSKEYVNSPRRGSRKTELWSIGNLRLLIEVVFV